MSRDGAGRPKKRQKTEPTNTMSAAAAESVADLQDNMKFMDQYSRQIGAFGLEAMLKLVRMKVLLVGAGGIGIETAKNTVLAGVHTLTLFDPEPTRIEDCGANFFLTEGDVGKPRGEVCAPKLAELNDEVNVVAAKEDGLTEELVAAHNCVVFTVFTPIEELLRWNKFCRTQKQPISFMYCFSAGTAGSLFVDHGPGFVMRDPDGKNPLVKMIDEVIPVEGGTIVRYSTPEGQPLGSLDDGGLVELSEVKGLCADSLKSATNPTGSVNGLTLRMSTEKGDPKFTFRISTETTGADGKAVATPLAGLSAWEGGGLITEKKEPRVVPFKSLEECSLAPGGLGDGLVMTDVSFSMRELQLHVAFQAIFAFASAENRLPGVNNVEDAAKVVALAKAFEEKHKVLEGMGIPVDEKVPTMLSMHAQVDLQPLAAFFGGILSQELVKISGKFTPIQQYFNFHAFETLPDETPKDTAPLGSRYDHFIAVFGKEMQERVGNLRIFMVGCGALGCEYVKNFALLGVCCGPEGLLTITDNDTIEVSNLNRQFLFRRDNVGQAKSVAATGRAQTMNKELKIDAKEDLVAPKTEHIFDDAFWSSQDLVCNALDNMQARFYVDGKCVFYELPLLESGTMGTGANVDVVVPHQTVSYADGGQADEGGGVPMCTLRNFPHLIDHCIEWARAQFQDLFVSPARAGANFLNDPEGYVKKVRRETVGLADKGPRATAVANALVALPLLKTTLEAGRKPTMEGCVAMAYQVFYQLFRDKIVDLTSQYPADAKTSKGDPFWSGHKKFPQEAKYDPSNEMHVEFMLAVTNLFASTLKIHGEKHPVQDNDPSNRWKAEYRDPAWLNAIVAKLAVPEYVKGAVSMDGDEEAEEVAEEAEAEATAKLEAILKELLAMAGSGGGAGFEPADFEKDDDDNFHIDFITACSNLRASNYHIPTTTRHKCKMIAGRIIPAIATTTASVTGLVMLEMMKVLQRKPIEKLRNGNYDIGTNTVMLFEANPPTQLKDEVVITEPDPKAFPDAYDDKGNLKDEYKDPDLMLGFAEWNKKFPNPHTKYDKVWIEDAQDMTVDGLIAAVNAAFAEANLKVSAVNGPIVPIEIPVTKDDPSGVAEQARSLWNANIGSTKANGPKKWVPLLKEMTTRTEANPLLCDPIDVSKKLLYDGLSFSLINDDCDDVSVPRIVLKLGAFPFVPYSERGIKPVVSWL